MHRREKRVQGSPAGSASRGARWRLTTIAIGALTCARGAGGAEGWSRNRDRGDEVARGSAIARFVPAASREILARRDRGIQALLAVGVVARVHAAALVRDIEPCFAAGTEEKGITERTFQRRIEGIKARFAGRALRTTPGTSVPELWCIFRVRFQDPDLDPAAACRRLRGDPDIAYVEPMLRAANDADPNDPFWNRASPSTGFNYLWSLERIGCGQAWDLSSGATGIVIAIVDSGIDIRQPDLVDNLWTNPGEIPGNGIDDDHNGYIDDVHGWDFVEDDPDPSGSVHGTHVAGIAAATGNNGTGVVGVAWKSSIMAVRGIGETDGAEGIRYAADQGADVINVSWRVLGISQLLQDVVAYATGLGCVVVTSAGNNGTDARTQSPAQSERAVTVSNVNFLDELQERSNYGWRAEIAAPGSVIFSCYPGDRYDVMSGTSQAAPHVSGAAALLLAFDPTLSIEQVRSILRQYCDDLVVPAPGAPRLPGPDSLSGFGRLNAWRALEGYRADGIALEAKILAPTVTYVQSFPEYVTADDRPVSRFVARTRIDRTLRCSGTAAGPGFAEYELSIGDGQDPASWRQLASSSAPVRNDLLCPEIDAGEFENGTHCLRLLVRHASGKTFEDRVTVDVDRAYIEFPRPEMLVFDGQPVRGVASGFGFDSYRLFYGAGKNPQDWTPLGDAVYTPVVNGTLLDRLPLESMEEGWVTLRMLVYGAGPVSEARVPIEIDNTHFPYRSGFPARAGRGMHWGPVTIADITGDDRPEILTGIGKELHAFTATGVEAPGWPVTFPQTVGSGAAVGDVDGDGYPEVAVKTWSLNEDFVDLRTGNGARFPGWEPITLPASRVSSDDRFYDGTPVLADVDGDGFLDIVFGSAWQDGSGGALQARKRNGQSLPGWPAALPEPVESTPAAGDVDGDGRIEIAAVTTAGNVYLVRHDGSVAPGWPYALGSPTANNPPVLADINNDGKLEVVASGLWSRRVVVLGIDGQPIPGWPQEVDVSTGPPAVGDVDRDGDLEIVVSGWDLDFWDPKRSVQVFKHMVYAFRRDGSPFTAWHPLVLRSRPFAGYLALADVDPAPGIELILAEGEWGQQDIRAFRIDGSELSGKWPIRKLGADNTALAIGDLDADGDLEIVYHPDSYTDLDGANPIHVWALPALGTNTIEWGQFQHDARHSGVYGPPAKRPSVDFTATPRKGPSPLSVTFEATNTGGTATVFQWVFGDGTTAFGPRVTHTYTADGAVYAVRLIVLGPGGNDIEEKPCWISVGSGFHRGDGNLDGSIDISDAIFILSELFASGRAACCKDSLDSNDSGGLDVADAVYLLGYLYATHIPPPAPFPQPGIDQTTDPLDCGAFP